MENLLMMIDGNSLIFRAFHALPAMNRKDGTQTNAAYGFFSMLLHLLDEYAPTYLAVAFDRKEPTFRKKMYGPYKANRKKPPEELLMQLPLIKKALEDLHVPILELAGYEADDIIGTVTARAEEAGIASFILTGDKDALQLVSEQTQVLLTKTGVSNVELYDAAHIGEVYGITPPQIVDMKGLMGDPSDNIPGIRGVGEKTACKLLKQFPSVEDLYAHIKELPENKLREKIEAGRESALLSKKLAAIERYAPLSVDLKTLVFNGLDPAATYDMLVSFEFFSIVKRRGLQKQTGEPLALFPIETTDTLLQLKKEAEQTKTLAVCRLGETLYFSAARGKEYSLQSDSPLLEDTLRSLQPVLDSPQAQLIIHDAKDFLHFCYAKGVTFTAGFFDTMLAEYVLDPTQRDFSFPRLTGHYAARGNASALFPIAQKQRAGIETHGLSYILYTIELPLCRVLYAMETDGFKVDVPLLEEFSADYEKRIQVATEEVYRLAGTRDFNISSTKQLGVILFEKLGLPVIKKTKTGYSTAAEVLEKLADRHPIIEKIMEYRLLTKIKSTYIDGLLGLADPSTHKVYTTFSQTATATGRISSIEPNLQNIPVRSEFTSQIRASFIPSAAGRKIVSADYSQIELRILAHISKDVHMCDAFNKGEDIHARTASQVFGVPLEEVTPEMRGSSKAVNFGIVYGISDFGLARNLGIPRYKAEEYINKYLNEFSGVRRYMKEVVEHAKEDGYVKTLYGRIRYIKELRSSNYNTRSFGERAALNTPIQGTAADIIKIAMIQVFAQFKKGGLSSRLISQVHDELIVDAAGDEVEAVKQILKDTMEHVVQLDVPLKVNIAVGDTWAEAK